MPPGDPPADEPPIRTFWWLKRLSIAFVILLLSVAVLRLVWGHRAQARLDAAVAEIQQQGHPILLQDMQTPRLPDSDNRAFYLRQALANWPTVGNGITLLDVRDYDGPGSAFDPVTDPQAYLAATSRSVSLLEQAASVPQADWNVQVVNPPIQMLLPHLGESRTLTRLVTDAAARAHRLGDDRLAMDLLLTLPTIERSLDTPPQLLITALVRISIRALAYDEAERLLPKLRVDADDPTAATPQQLQSLYTYFADLDSIHSAYRDGLTGERWSIFQTVQWLLNQPAAQTGGLSHPTLLPGVRPLIKPLLLEEQLFGLRYMQAMIDAAGPPPDPAQAAVAERMSSQIDTRNAWLTHPLTSILLPALSASHITVGRVATQSRLAAVGVAHRLHESRHGRPPDTLADLVPDVPRPLLQDPDASGRMIQLGGSGTGLTADPYGSRGYHLPAPQGRGVPVHAVWSVGDDGRDDGGRFVMGGYRYQEGDAFFLLETPPKSVHFDPGTRVPSLSIPGSNQHPHQPGQQPGNQHQPQQPKPQPKQWQQRVQQQPQT
jgi:hypothetical protein